VSLAIASLKVQQLQECLEKVFGKIGNQDAFMIDKPPKISVAREHHPQKGSIDVPPPSPPFVAIKDYQINMQDKLFTGYILS
jgi:hypothetical protein